MRIRNNIAALNAQIALMINESKLSKDLEKLTSGYRINRSGDDAAGLAISEQMRSQIAGLTQGELNAKDGLGLLRTGEGAMQEIHAMLIRMNGLAIRSANGVYTDEDHRELIQEEVDRISQEIDRIASATKFNYINLFHDDPDMVGDSGLTAPGTGTQTQANYAVEMHIAGTGSAVDDIDANMAADFSFTPPGTASLDQTDGTQAQVDYPVETHIAGTATGAPGTGNTADEINAVKIADAYTQASANYPINRAAGGLNSANAPQLGLTGRTVNSSGTPNAKAVAGSPAGIAKQADSGTKESSKIVFQVGPNAEHTISIPRFYLSKAALGLDDLDVRTLETAQEAIGKVEDMINYVSQIRGAYGAVDNALEHAINSMNVYKENITAAESRIRDTDMAKELTERTKDNILAQTSQAMLAQANALPETTLSLLR